MLQEYVDLMMNANFWYRLCRDCPVSKLKFYRARAEYFDSLALKWIDNATYQTAFDARFAYNRQFVNQAKYDDVLNSWIKAN